MFELKRQMGRVIYTIGHSNHGLEKFLEMLGSYHIQLLVDVRRFPNSRKYPQFNQLFLSKALQEAGIDYLHLVDLGGRRTVQPDSKNYAWKNKSFQGYADYMESIAFVKSITRLEVLATKQLTVYMCAEALWWRCHRSLISDYLKVRGWEVWHIMGVDKVKEHPYTSVAHIVNGELTYNF